MLQLKLIDYSLEASGLSWRVILNDIFHHCCLDLKFWNRLESENSWFEEMALNQMHLLLKFSFRVIFDLVAITCNQNDIRGRIFVEFMV